jgi:hypothetical protein
MVPTPTSSVLPIILGTVAITLLIRGGYRDCFRPSYRPPSYRSEKPTRQLTKLRRRSVEETVTLEHFDGAPFTRPAHD